jgi:ribonuclease HI
MTEWREAIRQAQEHASEQAIIAGSPVNREPEARPGLPVAIYCDGAVLGNPGGPGGWGMVVMDDAETIHRAHGPIDHKTNNEAEYLAIIQALAWLNEGKTPIASATIYSDSMLAVNQINGEWACRKHHLWQLCGECRRLAARLSFRVSFEWTPREGNLEADMEAARGVAEALGVDEEEALFVLAAQRKKYQFLKMNKKAKRLLFNAGLVSNLVTRKNGRRVIERGIPFAKMRLEAEQKRK